MKATSMVADLFMIIALLAVTILMTLFIWALIEIYEVEKYLGVVTPRKAEFDIFITPITYDTQFSAFLEFEKDGIPIKKLLEVAVIQNSTTVWLNGKFIDVSAATLEFLYPMLKKDYLLKIVFPYSELIVSSFGNLKSIEEKPLPVQKVSTKLFLLNGEVVDLQLLVKG
ncbi:MAG: hypothetical protein QW076_02910 [Candidatus Anstonellales archaeon]